uniref:ARID domain-containing protein n=1 Tax=Scleropages formosus TaxID=113540 RepID=A0A8C9S2M7_SCLFO
MWRWPQMDKDQMPTVTSVTPFFCSKVTANQRWKQVYNLLGGDPRSTSAATCTRRHYQKLILPFECYLQGLEEVALTPPQQHKRRRQNHSSDEDYQGEVKRRAVAKQMSSAFFQRSHEYQTDTCVQSIPIPVTFQQYSYPGFLPQSAYRLGFPSVLSYPQFQQPHVSPQPHLQPQLYTDPQHRASLELHSAQANDRPKEEVLRLRKLAVEYVYSSGWEKPLDLSHKERSLDSISQRPSSFSLPKGNGTPKFLNKVSSMYSSWNLAQDQSCEVSGNTATGKGANVKNFQRDRALAECSATTSPAATSSSASSRLSSGPFTRYNQNSSAYVVSPKTLQSNCPKSPEKEEEEPLNLKRSPSNPKINVEGQRTIEIPLKLLEAYVKSKYDPQDMCRKDKAVHPVDCPYTVQEDYKDMKKVMVQLPVEMDMVHCGKLEAKRHREIFKTHSSLGQQNIQQTSSVNTPWDREDMSDVGATKLRLACGVSGVPDGDNANVWPLFQCKDPETLKLLQRRWQYVQNLMVDLSDSKTVSQSCL